ncbi:cytochrome d ubiquinol oxidase subunit II [Streptomyces sp. enrichment culture]|uniref:cytochrome d ubiquinol oxidase subunit II n=1 Tax=Streptomyces sp. enrichment culture TaxID=1795815 RepID=UPI003F54C828
MSLETLWLALLGLLLAGYFVLGGYDYGVQMLHPFLRGSEERDGGGDGEGERGADNAALDAMAPFFLGNEVWLVAFAGVMFGAFPHLEGTLLSGLYPLIVAVLVGLVVGNAAIQLRRRARSAAGRRRWEALIVFGGVVPAVCWGLVVGLLLRGVPRRPDGSFHVGFGEVFSPFVLSCGVTFTLLLGAHGAGFVALRGAPGTAARARRLGAVLLRATGAAAAVPLLLTLSGAGADLANAPTGAVLAVLIAAVLAGAWWAVGRGHRVRAFAGTCLAVVLLVLLIGAGQHPYLLAGADGTAGLTVDEAVTDGATLKILTGFGLVLIPVILAYQTMSWWVFRGRTGRRHPSYF